jgi:phosphoglycolate phosphatase-like HAD superfamily hydrolase
VRSLGVSWGYHGADRLTAAGANRVVHTVQELKDCLLSFLRN